MTLAAVVLAAGLGTRLAPLTDVLPKALCPVGNVPLVDRAIARAGRRTDAIAVNIHAGRDRMLAHLADRPVAVSVEEERLETAGALGRLRHWLDGRDVLVVNADTYHEDDLRVLVEGWDGERVRALSVTDPARADWRDQRYVGVALLAWRLVRDLPARRVGLYPAVLAPAWEEGRLDLVTSDVPAYDCGTPAGYLAANLAWSGGASVVGPGAVVEGEVVRSVVWPGARVARGERLVEAVRASDDVTVHVGSEGTHREEAAVSDRDGDVDREEYEDEPGPRREADPATHADAGLSGASEPTTDDEDDEVG